MAASEIVASKIEISPLNINRCIEYCDAPDSDSNCSLTIERSPIHFTDRLTVPVILLQGEEDKIVPPNQAELFADAVRRKGLPLGFLLFE